jgi:membrane-associated HD superfamily phosphohydrolase
VTPPPAANQAVKRLGEGARALARTRFVREAFGHPWAITLLAALFLSLLITPHFRGGAKRYQAGRYAAQAVKATHDFDVEDLGSTEKRRQEAAAAIHPVYDFDDKALERQTKKLEDAFNDMRAAFGGPGENGGRNGGRGPTEEQEARFTQTLGVTLDRKTLDFLARDGFSPAVEAEIRDLLNYALSRLVVSDRKALADQVAAVSGEKAIKLRDMSTRRERPYTNIDEIVDAAKAQTQVERRARQNIEDPTRRAAVLAVAESLIGPTLDFNMADTEERRATAASDVGPSIIHFRKNQLIVGEGQQVTDETVRILTVMQERASGAGAAATFVAIAALLFLAATVVFRFGHRYIRKFRPGMRDYAFLLTAAVFAGMMAWLGKIVAPPLADSFSWLSRDAIRYLFPVAGFGMLVRFLLYSEAALVWLPFVSLACGLIVDGSLGYAAFVLIGSTIGAHQIGQA